ncbi:MAG TPA: Ig-like domain-containing protein, partial [Longimicrobiaceae bacterium]|nr:Ig-like domain-containing protein [Longimicrobiaceae bacterium]
PPARLEKLAGDAQQGAAASQLPLPVVVKVMDANGNPVAGASVAWRCSYGGSAAPAVSVTDVAGEARATWLLGPGAGAQAMEARVEGSDAAPVQFSANAGVGAPARLEKVSGDNQEAVVTRPLAEPLVVRVVDAPGNPLPGVKLAWKLFYGGGTVAPPESVTDAQGYARATWTLGTIMAHHRLEVRAVDLALPPVSFTALARVGAAAAVAKHGGDGQESEVGYTLPTPLVVRVTDAHGNPVPGVPVQWSGTGSLKSAETETDTLGLARGTWVLATNTGPQTMSATAAGRTVSFSASAYQGPSATIEVTPAAVSLYVGWTRQLAATVTDLFGNVGDGRGRALTWSSSDPRVATVSASGLVTATGGGEATVTATRDGVAGSARVWIPARVASVSSLGPGTAYAINAHGQIVGFRPLPDGRMRATLWTRGLHGGASDLGSLIGNGSSVAYDINDAGQVVGYSDYIRGTHHAVLWRDGAMIDLHVVGRAIYLFSYAHALNRAGHVVFSNPQPYDDILVLWRTGEPF